MQALIGTIGLVLLLSSVPIVAITFFFVPNAEELKALLAIPAIPTTVLAWLCFKHAGWLQYEGQRPAWHMILLIFGAITYGMFAITTFFIIADRLGNI